MIPEHSIESTDFSIEMPAIISKLALVIDMLRWSPQNDEFEDIDVYGAAMILMDIDDEIRTINRALYGDTGYPWDATESPETAT